MRTRYIVISGVTILVLAVFWKLVAVPQLTQRLPSDWSWTANYIGFSTLPDPITGQFPLTNTTGIYQRAMRIISDVRRPTSVQIEDSFIIRDIDTGLANWEYILLSEVNPANGQYVGPNYQGQYIVFPRHVQKKAYTLRANYLEGVPMAFQQEVEVEGLATYLFSYFGRGEYTNSYIGTQQYPGTQVLDSQEIKCDQDKFEIQIWVEPLTGEILKVDEGCLTGDFIFDRTTGEKLAAVFRWAGATAGDDVLVRAEQIRAERDRLLWLETTIPMILFSLALICLLWAGIRYAIERRRSQTDPSLEQTKNQLPFISLSIPSLLWQAGGFSITALVSIILLYYSLSTQIQENTLAMGSGSIEMLINILKQDSRLLIESDPAHFNQLQTAIDSFSTDFTGFSRISVVDVHMQVIADTDHSRRGKVSDQNKLIEVMLVPQNTADPFYYSRNGQKYMRLSHAILRNESETNRIEVIGAVSIDLPMADANSKIQTIFIYSTGVVIFMVLFHLALQYLFLYRSILVPIGNLKNAVQQIKKGHLYTRVQVHANNELGEVEQDFNSMAKEIERTSAELREKSQTLHTIIQSSPLAIIQLDVERKVKMWNPAAERIFGWSEADALDRPLRTIPPEKEGEMAALLETLAAGDLLINIITERMRKDGTRISVNLSASTLYDQNGNVTGFSSIIADISKIKQIELDMIASNDALSATVSSLELRTRELTLMGDMADLLQVCSSLDEAHRVVSRALGKIFPNMSGAIFEIPASRVRMEAVAVWGSVPITSHTFSMDSCWGVRRGRTYLLDDLDVGIVCQHVSDQNTDLAPYLCIPMNAQGDALGILHLICNSNTQRISIETQSLAETVAEQIALALSNLKLREVLRQQSIRDTLTGLFNRRYLDETLAREIERAKRGNTPLGVIMCDLDHFKRFNDTFGHEAGDLVLSTIGQILQEGVRADDLACRYGGEEFTIILPGASKQATLQRAEVLLTSIREIKLNYDGRALGPITMSLGIAMFPENGGNGQSLLQTADAALYRAKQNGRDRVETTE